MHTLAINDQVTVLAKQIQGPSNAVTETAKNVKRTQMEIRDTCQAMFELLYLQERGVTVAVAKMPSRAFVNEVLPRTDMLLAECFDTDQERKAELNKLNGLIAQGYPTPTPTSTPSATPTPKPKAN